MSIPALGEIKIVSFNFPPKGWAFCNGQLLPISQNPALFHLLGTTYGGDGTTTFALPDLRGRAPIHTGSWVTPGQAVGTETVTLLRHEMPIHTHQMRATGNPANSGSPAGNIGGAITDLARPIYAPASNTTLAQQSIASAGGSQPHENRQPFIALNYIIAVEGFYPNAG